MKSIIQNEKVCYLTGSYNGLHEHHVFGGPCRKISERYGLKIWLRADWHVNTDYCIHNDRILRERVQKEIQEIAMQHYGWSLEEWIQIFGRSFIL